MKTPQPQGYLTKEGVAIYKEIVKLLEKYDALEEIDSELVSMGAHYLYLFHKHAEEDPVQEFANGTRQVSPSFSIMKDAREGLLKISSKLGLSPKDRELIQKFKVKRDEEDALDDI